MRKSKITEDQMEAVRQLAGTVSPGRIADMLGVDYDLVYNFASRNGVNLRPPYGVRWKEEFSHARKQRENQIDMSTFVVPIGDNFFDADLYFSNTIK